MAEFKARMRQLKRESYALYLALRHPLTPWYARFFIACVVAYAFSPIDLIPDFIPVLGYLDDLILVPLGIALALRMVPVPVMDKCRQAAFQAHEKPTNWGAAIVIVLIWLLIAFYGVKFLTYWVAPYLSS